MFVVLVHVKDADTGEIVLQSQGIKIEVTEEELKAADERDAAAKAEDEKLMGGPCFSTENAYGRGKMLREVFDAIGVVTGKHLARSLASHFGNERAYQLLEEADVG